MSEPFEPSPSRWPFRVGAGFVVVALLLLLVVAISAAVLLNRSSDPEEDDRTISIAELNRDPEGWDGRDVVVSGTVEDVRTIPYLDQYALYTFRDATGTIRVLSSNGAPKVDEGEPIRLNAVYHSRVKLDAAIHALIEDQLGGLAGSIVGSLVLDIPLDVVFLEHTSYEPQ